MIQAEPTASKCASTAFDMKVVPRVPVPPARVKPYHLPVLIIPQVQSRQSGIFRLILLAEYRSVSVRDTLPIYGLLPPHQASVCDYMQYPEGHGSASLLQVLDFGGPSQSRCSLTHESGCIVISYVVEGACINTPLPAEDQPDLWCRYFPEAACCVIRKKRE